MNNSPEILCEAEILQDTLNTIDSSSGSKKGKSNSYDWEEFTPRDGERNAPEKRLIELGGTYQNDRALVSMRSKDGNGKGGKTGLYAQCAKVLNDEFPSMSVKCDPGNFKNKIHFMQQQYESAKRKYNDHLEKAKTVTGASWTLNHSTLVEPEGSDWGDIFNEALGKRTECSEDVGDSQEEGSISRASKKDDEGIIDLTEISRQALSTSIDLTAFFMDFAAAVSMAGKAMTSIGIGSLMLALNNVGEKGEAFVAGIQEQVRQDIAYGTMIQKRSELMCERADAYREAKVTKNKAK